MASKPQNAPRPSRPDAIRFARRLWLRGERLDVGQLAQALGLGRATLFRWFGTRDLLLAEVLWSLCEPTMARAEREASGHGASRMAQISERTLRLMQSFEPLRRFIAEDGEQALRLLTSRASPVQGRTIETVRRQLQQEVEAGWQPPLGLDTLAWLIVRIGESFLYASAISGQQVDIGDAGIAVQLLLSGRVEPVLAAQMHAGNPLSGDDQGPGPRAQGPD